MTKAEAKALSIEGWEIRVEMGTKFTYSDLPAKILKLIGRCGYCEKYRIDDDPSLTFEESCVECPLSKINKCCFFLGSPYMEYIKNPTSKNADKVLDAIKRS